MDKNKSSDLFEICVLIVTYGNRFNYLKQVVEACLSEGIKKIFIIDNNSEKESRKKLMEFESKSNRIEVVYLEKNIGSAGGYKIALEKARECNDCEYILLLDDDNLPESEWVQKLRYYWDKLEIKNKNKNTALCFFREDKALLKQALQKNDALLIIGRKNNFMGVHFIDIPLKIFKRVFAFSQAKHNIDVEKTNMLLIPVAPYGGLFFHKQLLENIPLPDENFFVYADDYHFSYKIPEIYLIPDLKIKDLEKSFHEKRGFFSTRVFNAKNVDQIYFMSRNNIIFQIKNKLISNMFVFELNIAVYLILNFILLPFNLKKSGIRKYISLIKGIRDGFREV